MSVHAAAWAWRQKVGDAGAKLVLIKLADQANDRGECWPSQKTLADECEMSPRTVQRKLEVLYGLGLVSAEQRKRANGSDSTLLYKLTPVRQSDAPPYDTGDAPPTTPVSYPEPSLEPTSSSEDEEGDADAPRDRDEIWDFLEEQFGSVGTDRRAQAHQKRNKAVADLRRLGATPDGIRYAMQAWSRQFVGATLTDIALATHYPQLTAGRGQTVSVAPVPAPLPPAAVLRDRALSLERGLKQGVCAECGIGGGNHTVDCSLGRETPRRAYEQFIEQTAANAAYPLEDIGHVIDSWRDLDDVERQHYRDLAEEIRANHEQEAA